ncbi:hypothetical protein Poli38472_014198 [Pythium oligandrum]|uniref:Uncharacterized protein n=1 Tax=Pythium oligandrum TaxID=41045 RepID=A0A8K1FIQ4_PYTOL|nr:hypothetical protein Poli38472_014198 [Pythium oligandrum]|eukprot:TMW64081.1 hypothetical protein Poli38472_014198 [Pythium oligandrum]
MRRLLASLTTVLLIVYAIYCVDAHGPRGGHRPHRGRGRKHPAFDRNGPHRPFRGGRVRRPKFEGEGCPPSTVELVNVSDSSTFLLSALFSNLMVQTTTESTFERKHCVVTVILEPQQNMSIGVVHVDFRGFAYVPSDDDGAYARLKSWYNLGRKPRQLISNATYAPGFEDDIYESVDITTNMWTPCRRDGKPQDAIEFRINARLTAVKSSLDGDDVILAVDSSDSGLYYKLATRPCGPDDDSSDDVPVSSTSPPSIGS